MSIVWRRGLCLSCPGSPGATSPGTLGHCRAFAVRTEGHVCSLSPLPSEASVGPPASCHVPTPRFPSEAPVSLTREHAARLWRVRHVPQPGPLRPPWGLEHLTRRPGEDGGGHVAGTVGVPCTGLLPQLLSLESRTECPTPSGRHPMAQGTPCKPRLADETRDARLGLAGSRWDFDAAAPPRPAPWAPLAARPPAPPSRDMRHAQTLCLFSCHPLRGTPAGDSSTSGSETVIDCKPEHRNCPQMCSMRLCSCFLLCCLILKAVATLDFLKWRNMRESVDVPVTSGRCRPPELAGVSWSPRARLPPHGCPTPASSSECHQPEAHSARGVWSPGGGRSQPSGGDRWNLARPSGRSRQSCCLLCMSPRGCRGPASSRVLTAVPLHGFLACSCIERRLEATGSPPLCGPHRKQFPDS